MPIEVGLWKLGESLTPVSVSTMESESQLEELLARDIDVVDPDFLLIGRQVLTDYGKLIDLLALDSEGRVVVIELKKGRTPREVVAQLLDYGSWARDLEEDVLEEIFSTFQAKYYPDHPTRTLEAAFLQHFGCEELPEPLNESHKLVLVAGSLDTSSERIITYLAEEHGVSINAVFFRVFRDEDREYLSRAWLADPGQVEAKIEAKREKIPWNGDFYVSFGADQNRDWDEAVKYGFVSAGGGDWYSRTLRMLEPGARIFVNIPGEGYVGVGIVADSVVPIDEFEVEDENGEMRPITSMSLNASNHSTLKTNPEKAEYFVRVDWQKTVPLENAFREKGFFGNQNSAAKPRARRWRTTVDRLQERFGVVKVD